MCVVCSLLLLLLYIQVLIATARIPIQLDGSVDRFIISWAIQHQQ